MRVRKFISGLGLDLAALVAVGIIFVVPFVFIFLTAAKTRQEAALFKFSWPSEFLLLENLRDCLLYTSPSPRDRQKSRMPSSA